MSAAFTGVSYPVNLTARNDEGLVIDLAALSASALRMEARQEYSTDAATAATAVAFLTDGTDGIVQGRLTFDAAGEWAVRLFATVSGTEFPSSTKRFTVTAV